MNNSIKYITNNIEIIIKHYNNLPVKQYPVTKLSDSFVKNMDVSKFKINVVGGKTCYIFYENECYIKNVNVFDAIKIIRKEKIKKLV